MTEKHGTRPGQKLALRLLLGAALTLIPLSNSLLAAQNPPTPTAQNSPAAPEAAFEVATIKPGSVGSDGMRFVSLNISPDGEVRATNWTLKALIYAAYNMSWWQVQGGPTWIEKEEYDLVAKPPVPAEGVPSYNVHHNEWELDDPKLRTMLQALLEDRFSLKTHLVTKEGLIYVLEKGDGNLTLTPNEHPDRNGGLGGVRPGYNNGRVLSNVSMATFARFLAANVLHQPVVDRTGLTGTYDYTTKDAPTAEEMRTVDTGIFLQYVKQMGLKLTKSTGPVTILVIDQASRPQIRTANEKASHWPALSV